MPGRNTARLREERLARRRENEALRQEFWNSQCKYYDRYTRYNERFNTWTSPEMSAVSLKKYEEVQEQCKKMKEMEEERNKRDLMLLEQKRKEDMEAQEEMRRRRNRFIRKDEPPLEILKEINQDLKAKEEARRRLEAERKLFEHWKINNPVIRQSETNQRQSNLKVAWLDAQIEKQMAKEKEEQELKKMLSEREQKMREEEEKEKEYQKYLEEKKKEISEIIHKQMEELKYKDSITELLRQEEVEQLKRKDQYESILQEREELQRRRARLETDLYNLNQYRLKLRRRAKLVADEVEEERQMLEKILEMQQKEKVEEDDQKLDIKKSIIDALELLKEQKELENKRQEYLAFIFDSEAKALWQKQENIWKQEQKARDDLFNDVIMTIKKQIDDKLKAKVEKQKQLIEEKENMLQKIEEADEELRKEKEEIERKKLERKKELDAMINQKRVQEKQAEIMKEIEREKQLEKLKQEEERLRKEIAQIQLQTRTEPVRYPRRRIVW